MVGCPMRVPWTLSFTKECPGSRIPGAAANYDGSPTSFAHGKECLPCEPAERCITLIPKAAMSMTFLAFPVCSWGCGYPGAC